ncbi:beta-ketoacyl [acyl carrier protein] synthase domain-containing protein [Actinoalloteichus hymeniacidonis]|uniref:Beta-ketoacyl synthase family protein,phosphopantetheine-containing protein n=1 Tax=Actinoalloteichus hymeniacidonis TaxID=340345 RepID=A0AAC9HSQ7_9PSEU|nr:polyketide synthase [Actinoalloteichus hymeniacidonis]AOS63785.1 beta-ketoacyl synthase family protein,phosphopantetheine-containing protein [Actinoalloteichus hymeniacidonis]MBB5908161.1 acyl transferase domain-containing protein/acyl carrier protein [Actinoalloteichus hymeniacidonis]
MPDQQHTAEIAIVGMSCRFPGAPDVEHFARLVLDGVVATSTPTPQALAEQGVPAGLRDHPAYVPTAGALTGIDRFDAAYFGIAPADAESMDPQHRLLLQEAVHALDDAGWPLDADRSVGVFCGAGENHYAARRRRGPTGQRMPWDRPAALPLLVSYHLDLRGPSVYVASMCSTSLSAVHLARRSLQTDDCSVALAGAVAVQLPDTHGYLAHPGGVMSPSGRCRPFDAAADGTVPGSGVAVLVLKRLADAVRDGDRVHAVLRGSALNNDGADRLSFAAPSVRGQREVIAAALADAAVDPSSVGYIEAHGTGTPLGDPVELAALSRIRAESGATGPCAVGAVKSSIGHLDEAAGMAGLVKAILAVRDGVVPPTAGHTEPNPAIPFGDSGLYVSTTAHPWPVTDGPRRAAVTSLGVGGTNGHVVVEQAPPAAAEPEPDGEVRLLPISAHTESAFDALCRALADSAHRPAHLAAALACRRALRPYRRAVIAADHAELVAELSAPPTTEPDGPLVFDLDIAADTTGLLAQLGADDDGESTLALAEALIRFGARPDACSGAGAGAYLALAAAGAVPAAIAVRCAALHAEGQQIVADGGDLSGCDKVVEEIELLLFENELAAPSCPVLLRASGVELPGSIPVAVDDVVEESRSAFMGLLESPREDGVLDLAGALASRVELLRLLGGCWERGVDVPWGALLPAGARRAPLRFPFDEQRHWAAEVALTEQVAVAREAAPIGAGEGTDDVAAEVAAIWREVLGVDRVAPTDSFFRLGGHSILATRILARLLDRLDVRCNLGALLEAETLAGMTEVVAEQVRLGSLYSRVHDTDAPADEDLETVDL